MELEEAFRRLRRNLATARERAEGAQLMRCAARAITECAAGSRSPECALTQVPVDSRRNPRDDDGRVLRECRHVSGGPWGRQGLQARAAQRGAPRRPHHTLCAGLIALFIARTSRTQVAKLTTSAGARRVSERELIRLMRFIDVGEGETDDEVSRDEMHQAMTRALEHGDGGVDAELVDGSAATGEARMAMIAHALVLRRLDEFMKKKHWRVCDLFKHVDIDDSGSISIEELRESLRKWRFFHVDQDELELYSKSHRRSTRASSPPSRLRSEPEAGGGTVRPTRITRTSEVTHRGATPRGDDLAVMAHLEQMVRAAPKKNWRREKTQIPAPHLSSCARPCSGDRARSQDQHARAACGLGRRGRGSCSADAHIERRGRVGRQRARHRRR